jgi:plasmid stabilization system protein ParE
MKYILSFDEVKDLDSILQYFSNKEIILVQKFIEDFENTCNMLLGMPDMACKISDELIIESPFLADVRRWSMKKFKQYIIFYKKEGKNIFVIRVINGKRDIPNLFDEWNIE